MIIATFIGGFVCCLALWFFDRREQNIRYSRLWDDYRKIVNEFSVRTGGRKIYHEPKAQSNGNAGDVSYDKGEFRILTPSMAEAEAMEADERGSEPVELTAEDLRHLHERGAM